MDLKTANANSSTAIAAKTETKLALDQVSLLYICLVSPFSRACAACAQRSPLFSFHLRASSCGS